jgi:hypothetical protein
MFMKSNKVLMLFAFPLLMLACEQPDLPELSDVNTLTSIELIVVAEAKMNDNGSKTDDKREIFKGVIAENGIISFPGISGLTDEQRQRARFLAIIPLTATIVEKDGAGNVIGTGLGGQRTISKKTYYFHVIAANGSEKRYVIPFN